MSEGITRPVPCPSTARAVLGAVDPDGAELRCGLLQGHLGEHHFELRWRDPQHDRSPSLLEVFENHIASLRADPKFQERLRRRIAEDKPILDRLAE